MVYKKYTKKIYKYRGGSNKNTNNKTGEDEKVDEKEISMFPKLDFSQAFFVDDMGLGFTPRTRKDYIKQSIVIKKKKQAEKKTLKEKMSTLTGLAPVKRMKNGLFKAIDKGMTEGAANYRDFLNKAERLKEYVTLEGKYGKEFKKKLFKAADGAKGISSDYKKASRRLDPRFDKDGNKIVKKNKSTSKNILNDIGDNKKLLSLFANIEEINSKIDNSVKDIIELVKTREDISKKMLGKVWWSKETVAWEHINMFHNFINRILTSHYTFENNKKNIIKMKKAYESFSNSDNGNLDKQNIKYHLKNKNFYNILTNFTLWYFGLCVSSNLILGIIEEIKSPDFKAATMRWWDSTRKKALKNAIDGISTEDKSEIGKYKSFSTNLDLILISGGDNRKNTPSIFNINYDGSYDKSNFRKVWKELFHDKKYYNHFMQCINIIMNIKYDKLNRKYADLICEKSNYNYKETAKDISDTVSKYKI